MKTAKHRGDAMGGRGKRKKSAIVETFLSYSLGTRQRVTGEEGLIFTKEELLGKGKPTLAKPLGTLSFVRTREKGVVLTRCLKMPASLYREGTGSKGQVGKT